MSKKYYANWSANGNSTYGRLGPYTSKASAIREGREVLVGNQFVGGPSGNLTVELWDGDCKTIVFASSVVVHNNGSVVWMRNHDAEGLDIVG